MGIHRSAVIDSAAEIDSTADIGPYAVIEGRVSIGPRTRVMAHAVVCGPSTIGSDNVIHYGAVVGHEPQDLSFKGEESWLRLGDRNVIREHVTIHRGTAPGSETRIGNDNYLMAHSHVAHNVRLGNRVTVVNGALLAGHVQVDDQAFISGNCAVHQHVRVGRLAFMRGRSGATRDVPPFCVIDDLDVVRALNLVGLRRAGFDDERIRALRRAFARLFGRRGNLVAAIAEVEAGSPSDDVRALLAFIRESKRGVCTGPRAAAADPCEPR